MTEAAQNAKMLLHNKLSKVLGRPLTKTDVVYTTEKTGEAGSESYQTKISIPDLDGGVEIEGPAVPLPGEGQDKGRKAAEAAVCQVVLDQYQETFNQAATKAPKRKTPTSMEELESVSNGNGTDSAAEPPLKKAKVPGGFLAKSSGFSGPGGQSPLIPVDAPGTVAGAGPGIAAIINENDAKNRLNKALARILKRCIMKDEIGFLTQKVPDGYQCTVWLPDLPLHYRCIPTVGEVYATEQEAQNKTAVRAIKAIAVIQRILGMKGAKRYVRPNF